MAQKKLPAIGLVLVCLVFSLGQGCGKKSLPYVAVIDSDTLTITLCKALVPDSAFSPAAAYPLCREILLSRLDSPAIDTAVMRELADQLSLQSGQQWNYRAALTLYQASRVLRLRLLQTHSGRACAHEFDSLAGKRIVLAREYSRAKLSVSPDTVWKSVSVSEAMLPALLPSYCVSLFAVKKEAAAWVSSFLFSEENAAAAASSSIKQMVTGLIFDSAAARRAPQPRQEVTPHYNNKEILKHRSQQSISDSISKHSAELEGIYKMRLKLAPQMAGTVWISFKVRPDGSVANADLRSSQISDPKFMETLQAYALTMRFKPVAETLGDMTFEFPFHFTPEQ